MLDQGTGCASRVSCRIKELAINRFRLLDSFCDVFDLARSRCNYARGATQLVYEGLNSVTHVLGVVVSLLCGTRFVLLGFPPCCHLFRVLVRRSSCYLRAG